MFRDGNSSSKHALVDGIEIPAVVFTCVGTMHQSKATVRMQWNEFVLVEELTESSGTVIMGTSETRDVAHGIVILPVAIDNVYNVHCVNITSGCTYDTEADRASGVMTGCGDGRYLFKCRSKINCPKSGLLGESVPVGIFVVRCSPNGGDMGVCPETE
ncbi:hypothetical protein MCOR22_010713 [Pyricularia oryzae]|nr:hypothetical protein MCOR22_010713 [Pyricularia oryzae]